MTGLCSVLCCPCYISVVGWCDAMRGWRLYSKYWFEIAVAPSSLCSFLWVTAFLREPTLIAPVANPTQLVYHVRSLPSRASRVSLLSGTAKSCRVRNNVRQVHNSTITVVFHLHRCFLLLLCRQFITPVSAPFIRPAISVYGNFPALFLLNEIIFRHDVSARYNTRCFSFISCFYTDTYRTYYRVEFTCYNVR